MQTVRLTLLFTFFLHVGCVGLVPIQPLVNWSQCNGTDQSIKSIVGGVELRALDPDQQLVTLIRIQREGYESICTGTLVSDQIIMTAAHCVIGVQPYQVISEFVTEEGCARYNVRKAKFSVEKILIHKAFDGTPKSLSDIALLYLEEEAPKDQKRVAMLKGSEEDIDDQVLLLGFGITREDRSDSRILRKIKKSIKQDILFRNKSLIIDQRSGSGGFCRGDSGAPVIGFIWGVPHIMAVNSANIGITPQRECQTLSLGMSMTYFSSWVVKNSKKLDRRGWLDKLLSPSVMYMD